MRISWQEYALNLANVAKQRSEDPFVQVGACALDRDHRVLGCAYNGLAAGKDAPPDFWVDRDFRRPFMIHAETNLLSLFKRGEARLVASTLLPCSSCAQALAAYGVEEVVYRDEYERAEQSKEIFKFYNIKLMKL